MTLIKKPMYKVEFDQFLQKFNSSSVNLVFDFKPTKQDIIDALMLLSENTNSLESHLQYHTCIFALYKHKEEIIYKAAGSWSNYEHIEDGKKALRMSVIETRQSFTKLGAPSGLEPGEVEVTYTK